MKTGWVLATRWLSAWGIGLAALFWSSCDQPSRDIAVLVRALGGHRPSAARLTGGFAHGPCREPRGEAPGVQLPRCLRRLDRSAIREVSRQLDRLRAVSGPGADAATLHATGIAELLAGSPERAVRRLAEASARAPTEAKILSDLAAAYLARAEARNDPRDLVRALGRALETLQRDNGLREARFNKALALESLGLRSAAAAWGDASRSEPASEWTAEAQAHAERLGREALAWRWRAARGALERASQRGDAAGVQAIVARFPQASRLVVEEEILPGWAAAYRAGRESEARAALALAMVTANALRETGRDPLLADAIANVAAIQRDGDPARLDLLASGFAAYGDGIAAYADNRIDRAVEHFAKARRHLVAAGSPFTWWTMVHLANCDYRREEYADTLAKLDEVLGQPRTAAYPSLRGRALWIEGVTRISLAQPADALRAYRLSLANFEAAREHESAVTLHALLADALDYVGEERVAWQQRYLALRGLRLLQSPRRRLAVLTEAATAALRLGEPESALYIQEEAVGVARRSGDPLDLAEGLRVRAVIELRCREQQRTVASLREAERELRKLGHPELEQAATGELLDLEGRLLLSADPTRALRLFVAATRAFQQTNFRARLAESYLNQALASLALHDLPRAQAALEAGISSLESEWQWTLDHRSQGLGDDFGSAYTEQRRRLFDEMLRLLTDQAQAGRAFDYAERLHNWGLLDQALRLPSAASYAPALDTGRPISHQALRASLPTRTAIIEYAQLEDRLITWIIQRGSLRMTLSKMERRTIDEQVKQFYTALAAGRANGSVARSLTNLHSSLIEPILRYLHLGETLVFVPDRSLSAVPFSALRNSTTGRFLIQDFPLSLAPSATLYLQAVRRDRQLAEAGVRRALVLGDPAFDPRLFPDLSRLSGAAAEATDVAGMYPGARLLLGSSATRERFLTLAGSYPVVHLAAHARTLESSPLASALALASGGGGESGAVYAHELLRLRFLHTRLLVLSTCSSVGGNREGNLRISGFVRPLLAAGIPAVIGTLWQVDDQAATSLMTAFHESYRQLDDAPAALRAAQLRTMAISDDPLEHIGSWAAFQAYGTAAIPGHSSNSNTSLIAGRR
jgi:CHAT domain-containing protein